MTQNIFDQEDFFAGYGRLPRVIENTPPGTCSDVNFTSLFNLALVPGIVIP